MLDVLPGSLRRVLALRQFAPLSSVDLAELAMVAENVAETTLLAGNRIVAQGARVRAVHLILDGKIEAAGQSWGPREVYGLLEVLARRPAAAPAIASVDTRVLRITAGDMREILEDNFGMLRAVLGDLSTRMLANGRTFGFGAPVASFGERMTLVERLIALRQHSPLAGGRLQALTAVAQILEQSRWETGDVVIPKGAPPDRMILVLDGALRAAGAVFGPGDSIGALEAFAGTPHSSEIVASAPTSALICPVVALIDILEDHGDLGLTMVSTLAKRLLDLAAPN